MGKKAEEEVRTQHDGRLKPQEAISFKNSKSTPKASAELVIALASPATKNMDIVHVKRASKVKTKSRRPTDQHSNDERRIVTYIGAVSGEPQPPSGDDVPEKELPNSGNKNTAAYGIISNSIDAADADDLNLGRKLQKKRSPPKKKVTIKIKSGSSRGKEITSNELNGTPQHGNVTLRNKSPEITKDFDTTILDGDNGRLEHESSTPNQYNNFGNSSQEKYGSMSNGNLHNLPRSRKEIAGQTSGNAKTRTDSSLPSFRLVDSPPSAQGANKLNGRTEGLTNINQNKHLWRDMFAGNRNALADYKLTNNQKINDDIFVELTEADADNLAEHWGYGLLAYIAGRSTGKQAVDDCCKRWGVPYVLHFHTSGWIIIKFNTEEDRDKVLLQGPYYVFGKLLMLKELPKYFDFGDYEINHIPVWVHIMKLPLDFWNTRTLSKLGGFLGKPIQTDKITFTRGRVSFVRILVEMDLSKSLPETIPIKLPNGRAIDLKVEYEFIPKICAVCKGIGHLDDRCFQLHPELKPKNTMSNGRPNLNEQPNTKEKFENRPDHAGTNKGQSTNNNGRPPQNSEMFHSSQSASQNLANTSSKKGGTSGLTQIPASQIGKKWVPRPDQQPSEKQTTDRQDQIATEIMDTAQNIPATTETEGQTEYNRVKNIVQGNSPRTIESGSLSPSINSDSSKEDGEFQQPKRKHTTRNTNWTKAVFIQTHEGRGPAPSSPQ